MPPHEKFEFYPSVVQSNSKSDGAGTGLILGQAL